MKAATLRRLETLEQVTAGPEPVVIVLAPPEDAPGHYWECDAYQCQKTGLTVQREPEESMPAFVVRTTQAAEHHAAQSHAPFMLLHPDRMR